MTPTSISSTTREIPWETRTVTRSQILEVANEILAREGAGSVSLGRVARELGEKLPPLYEHFCGEDELLLCLAADVLLELTRELEDARADLLGQAYTYRRFALEHPRQYRLLTECPLPSQVPADGLRARPPRAFLEQPVPSLRVPRGRSPTVWSSSNSINALRQAQTSTQSGERASRRSSQRGRHDRTS
jgi:AcrR family transcriptional regulator